MSDLDAKRDEIATLIAKELGFGDLASLSLEDRAAVDRQTTETIQGCNDERADCTDAHVKLAPFLAEYRALQEVRAKQVHMFIARAGIGTAASVLKDGSNLPGGAGAWKHHTTLDASHMHAASGVVGIGNAAEILDAVNRRGYFVSADPDD